MVLFDTNAVLRYILQDNLEMAEVVEQQMSNYYCYIPVEVVAEVVYVLYKVYKIKREIISQIMIDITNTDKIRIIRSSVVRRALKTFASTTLDFVDCLLIGYAKEEQYSIFTFDKKLQKHLAEI